jgi:hypothetical protein
VLRRLRRSAEHSTRPRTYTRHAYTQITAAAELLDWLWTRGTTLQQAGQGDIECWLTTGAASHEARDFVLWATKAGHTRPLIIPARGARRGPATAALVT